MEISAILAYKGTKTHSVAPDATVYEAIQIMADHNIGALLVMSGNRLEGIISERDYTRKVALKGKSSRTTPVREIMFDSVVAVTPKHTVTDCMRLMTDHRIRHLPVMEADKVVGIISIGDLVNWTISTQAATINQLETFIQGQYPG